MAYKTGSEIKVGDLIFVGLMFEGPNVRLGRIARFEDHPRFAELVPGYSARIAHTDRGSITICDQQQIQVPD